MFGGGEGEEKKRFSGTNRLPLRSKALSAFAWWKEEKGGRGGKKDLALKKGSVKYITSHCLRHSVHG